MSTVNWERSSEPFCAAGSFLHAEYTAERMSFEFEWNSSEETSSTTQ